MQIRVCREACCAADDQAGPLETVYGVSPEATLKELIDKIESSGFLQYSASHVALLGHVDGQPLVKVFSPYHLQGQPADYVVSPNQRLSGLLGADGLSFRFVFDSASK